MPAVLIFGFVIAALWLYSSTARAEGATCAEGGLPVNSYGFTLNNPGNLRWIADAAHRWQGMVENVNGYARFDTLSNGVRAIGKQLAVDYSRGADTLTKLITVWAPAADSNNVPAYVQDVANRTGIGADDKFAFQDAMPDIAAAIIVHENGYNNISTADMLTYLNS